MPNWIGDLIMGTPILADLRAAFPKSSITAMALYPLCTLLEHDPHIDELFCFIKPHKMGRRKEKRNIIQKLKTGKYDLGILLPNSFSSAWWFWQGNVKRRIGFSGNLRSLFLTQPLPFPKNRDSQHLVLTYKELLKPLQIPISETIPHLYVTNKEREVAGELLAQHGVKKENILVGFNVGAAFGTAKCWLPERFKEVADRLLQNPNIFTVFFGDINTAPAIKDICQELNSRAINLAGTTSLRELAALISLCDVLLTNDSGPMHIASALDIPLVALFGSTNDITTGPYNKKAKVIHKHVSCSPCYLRNCPIDFRCMKNIEVDEVYQTVIEQIKTYAQKTL